MNFRIRICFRILLNCCANDMIPPHSFRNSPNFSNGIEFSWVYVCFVGTVVRVKMQPELAQLALLGVRLLIFLPCAVWIRLYISLQLVLVNLHSETLRQLLNVWLMNSSMLPRVHLTGNWLKPRSSFYCSISFQHFIWWVNQE